MVVILRMPVAICVGWKYRWRCLRCCFHFLVFSFLVDFGFRVLCFLLFACKSLSMEFVLYLWWCVVVMKFNCSFYTIICVFSIVGSHSLTKSVAYIWINHDHQLFGCIVDVVVGESYDDRTVLTNLTLPIEAFVFDLFCGVFPQLLYDDH